VAVPIVGAEPLITKPMFQAAQKGLGMCLRCREKLAAYEAIGIQFPEVKAQIDQWQPPLEGVVQLWHEGATVNNAG
jgi:hypothetical protein